MEINFDTRFFLCPISMLILTGVEDGNFATNEEEKQASWAESQQ